jgi:cobyrinic acid a,c-diamide synthase
VAPFKVGPDYIDPGYHQKATGRPSRNLDTWLTSAPKVQTIQARGSADADISVIEGVMGLFDGRAGGGDDGSTAEVALITGGAVVLVVDCARLARSLAPLLMGFDRFDERLLLAGVILNNVGSRSHGRMLRDAAREVGVTVLGEIPRDERLALGSRHLGLVPAAEQPDADAALEMMIEAVGGNVDIDALLDIAEAAPESQSSGALNAGSRPPVCGDAAPAVVSIAVARDEAFSFYYVDGLEALEAAGARLVYFSPLRDEGLPACDGVYLGGGFPEMFAAGLEANSPMRGSMAGAIRDGLPVYAECGGMVYLCRGVEVAGRRHEMVGAIDSEAQMTGRRQALGYVEARARRSNILMDAGERVRGHEFHWSTVRWQEDHLAYDCFSSKRPEVEPDGYSRGNLLASYVHIHFAGEHAAAARFVRACDPARERGGK